MSSSAPASDAASYRATWDRYGDAWRTADPATCKRLVDSCMTADCKVLTPESSSVGHSLLLANIAAFQTQMLPGGGFVTTSFITHNQRALAKWDMVDAKGTILGRGHTYTYYSNPQHIGELADFPDAPAVQK